MNIRKINEDLEKYDCFEDGISKYILSKELIEDYFSLVDDTSNIKIKLSIRDVDREEYYSIDDFNGNDLPSDDILTYMIIVNLDVECEFYSKFESEDSFPYFKYDEIKKYLKILEGLNSINNKINIHDHTMLISFDYVNDSIICCINNNKN